MQDFWLYFQLGRDHIADWKGYDHILFVTVLCLRYLLKDWRKVLVLVTAFTIGHSITLALSVLNYVTVSVKWIEFLIPVTIVITAISNIWQKDFQFKTRFPLIYFFALFFGLIHGMGFASSLNEIGLPPGKFYTSILSFNVGVELGQIAVITAVFLLIIIPQRNRTWYRRLIVYPFSLLIALVAAYWTFERVFY